MSLFSWLSAAKKPAKAASPPPESSGLSRMDSTKPFPGRALDGANGQPANRKGERMARRELLYGVVRECMTKAGVLSTSYKFKVLSLDSRGRQFLVMVDLARPYGSETSNLAEIEAMVAQAAKARFDIIVTAVYWRMNEHVAIGLAGQAGRSDTPSGPAPLQAEPPPDARRVAPQSGPVQPESAPLSRAGTRYEAIQGNEVEAFKRALAAGASAPQALASAGGAAAREIDGSMKHGPRSYTLLTGFEDTEMAESDLPAGPALSATQYGDPR